MVGKLTAAQRALLTLDKDWVKRAIADGFSNGNEQYDDATEPQRFRYDMAADAVLAAAPPPVITEAMVERGARGLVTHCYGAGSRVRDLDLARSRACLEAALRPGGGE